ncbi:ferredoxin family protein [Arcanobacterium pinnipediorum]|uniref:Ferredoxin-like protein n=1 Tax=Arcanobacterium pinnipediorum TaxID=1503041 RepID=A0ABY5AJ02_9ACTO|nr:4Fe-4S dicluster domain-containing protein [Arcanobacterium pinnipediorum]USR79956.1 4Fe-4S dicluster domain-containing protein [Arcanobacterium pinnipediorum]
MAESKFSLPPLNRRLAGNAYETDDGNSHIEIHQEALAASGFADTLIRICPAKVYSKNPDGTVAAEYAACLECGTCLALAPSGTLSWHYPESGMGISYREG